MQSSKIVRAIFLTIAILGLQTEDGLTICKESMINPASDVYWSGIFPIKVAQVPIGQQKGMVEPIDAFPSSVCICPAPYPRYKRIGVTVSYWEPSIFIETVKDAYCFPGIGQQMNDEEKKGLTCGTHEDMANQEEMSSFAQAHFFYFPAVTLMQKTVDNMCEDNSQFDLGYITEIDPMWNDDELATILQPETLMFANYAAVLSCVADSVSANLLGLPLPFLFWCMGSWGPVFPVSGHVNDDEYLQANAAAAGKFIYKMCRIGLIQDTAMNVCINRVYTPIWIKWHYRLQLAKPVRGNQLIPMGRTEMIWGPAMNPPVQGDNFAFIVFRKRLCCASK